MMREWFQAVGRVGRDLIPQPWGVFLSFCLMVFPGHWAGHRHAA